MGQYAAVLPALESAYRVGSVVVDRLVADWAACRDTPPVAPPRK
jgi:purine nucleoside permease